MGNGDGNVLLSVAAVSSSDIWAVGFYVTSIVGVPGLFQQTLVEHWDGTAWSIVASPNVGPGSNGLNGIVSTGANSVWAVGFSSTSTEFDPPTQTLVEHWDGTTWSVVTSPNGGKGDNVLTSIAAVPATGTLWAVGYDSPLDVGVKRQTLTMHFDGTAWSIVTSPNRSTNGNVLNGVAVVSATNIWAVGDTLDFANNGKDTLILHWDGTSWRLAPSPSPGSPRNGLAAVAAVPGAHLVWAVGTFESNSSFQTLSEGFCR